MNNGIIFIWSEKEYISQIIDTLEANVTNISQKITIISNLTMLKTLRWF